MGDDLNECPVCLETFKDPHILRECGHTFCKPCIQALQSSSNLRQGTRCPTCRAPFRLNNILPNYAVRQIVAQHAAAAQPRPLVTNSAIESLPTPAQSKRPPPPRRQQSVVRDITDAVPTVDRMMELGMPSELAKLVVDDNSRVARRIFLLDNSGSTQSPDGKILRDAGDNKYWQRCTRWEEIKDMAINHAKWNLEFGTPAEFVILNTFSSTSGLEEGIDFFMIDKTKGNGDEQIQQFTKMLNNINPRGTTPIADRIKKIREQLTPQATDLARNNQQVILILVTDGLPTNLMGRLDHNQLVAEFRRLNAELPVMCVVRLCTDDNEVAEFYNEIDSEVELQLDIVDDMMSEAHECYKAGNYFFSYSPLIQLIREGGSYLKVLDVLDERLLTPMEVALLCQLLVRGVADQPLPTEPQAFCDEVRRLLPACAPVWDAYYQRLSPPVSMRDVEWAILPKSQMRRECAKNFNGIDCAIL